MTRLTTGTIEIPTAGEYRIDPQHATVSFTIRHLFGLGQVRGSWQLRDGYVHIAGPVHGSTARARISAASFHTGSSVRDTTIRSAHYLDTDNLPDITFTSTRLDRVDGQWVLHGSLIVRGHTRPVRVHIDQIAPDGSLLRLRASARVDRYEFGITKLKGLIGRHLTLTLDITAYRT